MSVRIRLQRHGRKRKPFYYIVAADQRTKRDGRNIERIGSYDPTRNPALIDLDFEKALKWVENGAQPSDTCRAILSYKGVLMRDHLNRGVKKGALTQEQADAKFEKWLETKADQIDKKKSSLSQAAEKEAAERLKAEKEVREKREAVIAERQAEEAKAAEEARAAEEAANAPAEEEAEAPAEEKAEKEAPKAAAEEKKEDAPESDDKKEEKAD